jgi:hypothetical protein
VISASTPAEEIEGRELVVSDGGAGRPNADPGFGCLIALNCKLTFPSLLAALSASNREARPGPLDIEMVEQKSMDVLKNYRLSARMVSDHSPFCNILLTWFWSNLKKEIRAYARAERGSIQILDGPRGQERI